MPIRSKEVINSLRTESDISTSAALNPPLHTVLRKFHPSLNPQSLSMMHNTVILHIFLVLQKATFEEILQLEFYILLSSSFSPTMLQVHFVLCQLVVDSKDSDANTGHPWSQCGVEWNKVVCPLTGMPTWRYFSSCVCFIILNSWTLYEGWMDTNQFRDVLTVCFLTGVLILGFESPPHVEIYASIHHVPLLHSSILKRRRITRRSWS
jgi:hypothetical protein